MIQQLFIALLLLLAIIFFIIAYKYIRIIRVKVPKNPHITIIGTLSENINTDVNIAQSIPRIIWTYWHELPAPKMVELCQKNWRQYASNHEIRLINKATIGKWITPEKIPEYFHTLPAYRQADWLRLQLLAQYGGIWVDASIIMTQDLDWVHKIQLQEKTEYVGFYIHLYTNRLNKPIIENWFMAAVAGSNFIIDLAHEFNHAITLGERAYLDEINRKGRFEQVVQLLAPQRIQEYLIMHVAASVLLDREQKPYRLALFRAEDTAFAFHALLKWSKRSLQWKLALTPCPKQLPFIIKLRGGERNRAEKFIAKGWYYKGSLLAKFLNP